MLGRRDVASRRGPVFWVAFLRPFLVLWPVLVPRSPTVMTRNSHDIASPVYESWMGCVGIEYRADTSLPVMPAC